MKARAMAVTQLGTIPDNGTYEALVHVAADEPRFWNALWALGYENNGVSDDSDIAGYDEAVSVVIDTAEFDTKSDFIKQLRKDVGYLAGWVNK